LIISGTHLLWLIQSHACFILFVELRAENQLKYEHCTLPAHRACINIKLLRRKTPDFITAPNPWLPNISDFSPVDYRILAVLQELVYNLCEISMSWGNIWLTVGQAFSRQSLVNGHAIDQLRFRLTAW